MRPVSSVIVIARSLHVSSLGVMPNPARHLVQPGDVRATYACVESPVPGTGPACCSFALRSPTAMRTVTWDTAPLSGIAAVMLTLGLIRLILGFVLGIPALWTIGVVVALVGAVLWLADGTGARWGRRWY